MWRLIFLLFISCSSNEVKRISDYLKESWDLRKKSPDNKTFAESIKRLDSLYGWDIDSIKTIVNSWQDVADFDRLFNNIKEER